MGKSRKTDHLRTVGWMAILLVIGGTGAVWLVSELWHSRRPAVVYSEPGWAAHSATARWDCIVIHHSATAAGNAARFDQAHRDKGWDELGYHFVIGNGSDTVDGLVEVGSRWTTQKHGAHCKTQDGYYNAHGIGICLVGNFDESRPSAPQLAALSRLVHFLSQTYKIPPEHIYSHGGVTGQTRCPGRNLSLEMVRNMARHPDMTGLGQAKRPAE